MCKLLLSAGLLFIITRLASSTRLVCYYDSSADDRVGKGRFRISDIDPNQCTHLIFAFADIRGNLLVPKTRSHKELYQSFTALKNRNPQLKTLLAVNDAGGFRRVVSNAVKRSRFIGSAVNLLRTFGFDGLSLDFLPGAKKGRFTQLIQALKREFSAEVARSRRSRLLLVAGVSAEKDVIEASYDVRRIAGDLDFINVRTFNFRGARETVAVHHSPLFKGSQDAGNKMNSDTDFAMWHWRIQGAPAEKLNLGIASFGRVYTLTHTSSDVGAPVSGLGREGNFTRTRGQWAYYEVCKNLGDAKIHEIPDQKVPYATVDDQWVGFDDLASLTTKVNYLKNNDFGGAFIWSLDLDDFSGDFCQQGKSPLTTSLHDLLFPEAPDVNNFCRSRPDGLYINPSNQHKFFSCAHGITYSFDCPANLIFNPHCNCCDYH